MGSAILADRDRKALERLGSKFDAEDRRRSIRPVISGNEVPVQESQGAPVQGQQGFDLGLVEEATRQKVRAFVESQPPILQFLIEAAPATIGTLLGTPGGIAGAVGGGVGFEALGQELGVSPRSNVGLALALGGPLVGRTTGSALKGIRKATAAATGAVIPARVALAKSAMLKASDEFESLGAKILNRGGHGPTLPYQKDLMSMKASSLYDLAEKAGVRIPAFRTTATRGALAPLRKELSKMKALPDVRAAIRLLDDIETTLKGSSISFADLIATEQMVGRVIKTAGGVKEGVVKQFFKAIKSDVDHLASLGGKTGNVGKVAQAASKRYKLQKAVKSFEEGVAQFQEYIPGQRSLKLDLKGFRRWLLKATNPKSKQYNKDMTEALKDELPGIEDNLVRFTKFTDASPGGPGSLVVRTITAGAGAAFGHSIAGGPGAVVGGLAGARIPEMLTAILCSGPAITFLEKATALGSKPITAKMWDTLGQIAAQGAKTGAPNRNANPGAPAPQLGTGQRVQ